MRERAQPASVLNADDCEAMVDTIAALSEAQPASVVGAERCEGGGLSPFCPAYHEAIELIGRRWTGAILRVLLSGATRFTDITATIPGLSDRLLSERLKQLESEGIVIRTVYPETPVRVEYGLTPKGRALTDVVIAVSAWAETWLHRNQMPDRRPASGSQKEARTVKRVPAGFRGEQPADEGMSL